MSLEIVRRPRARLDLIEIWTYVADDNEAAADRLLRRIESVLAMLADTPLAGRARPELSPDIRSFPIGNYVIFYIAQPNAIDVVRVLSRYRDIAEDDMGNDA
ncbi:type II toxin-antitoxin system RelE/ParE family toxin [Pleomorphomonas sp. JP5]|uniref:type II toxin-antitoxin system RelE/ParE family toxin n=1 Tax=Pleomorphomonas sp. JP5 TaxID=2942998 RepID=UPI0020441A6E|nr:type II toxin-antitoxin system RelE/ParE family toxin [Pleomorphomonas sp. JP5]MCM5557043.1 type II toxin-antitoxin system RelE/ParE family toxin [Pleomorphomonas sp. JP5]